MKITFLGATQTVTGSKTLLTLAQDRQVLVDCGLFQGHKELRLRNWAQFPMTPHHVDFVALTHAHIDHSGYLPLFIKQGFVGKVLCSKATRDLCSILLPDSGYLQEEEARFANKKGYSKHKTALPLYTRHDAEQAMNYFQTLGFEEEYALYPDTQLKLFRAGHILGASFVFLQSQGTSVLFSGDIGRYRHPVMYPPAAVEGADYVVVESTYGNRIHDTIEPLDQIADIINDTARRKGCVIAPAFSVGRTQTFLLDIFKLKQAKRIPDIPVYLDSPLAINATKIFCRHSEDHKLTRDRCYDMCGGAQYVREAEDSKALDVLPREPMILVSASGMATGGRILHHLKAFAPDAKNTILFLGYQSPGTRGDRIVRGETEVKIHGRMIPIRAQVKLIESTSAHADSEEILRWLSGFTKMPKTVFINHGSKESSAALKEKIEKRFGWTCVVPEYLYEQEL